MDHIHVPVHLTPPEAPVARVPIVALLSAVALAATVTAASPPQAPAAGAPAARAPLDHTGVTGRIIDVPARGTVVATADCPAGTEPSGGGGGTTGQGTLISGSAPSGNSWNLTVSNLTGENKQAAGYVLCTHNTHARVTGPAVTVPAGGTATAFASCPSGEHPAGGGFVPGRGFLSASAMYTDPSGRWKVTVANNDGAAQTVSAFVLCTPAPVTLRESSRVLAVGEQAHETAACADGQRPSGGGGYAAGSTGAPGVVISSSRGLPEGTGPNKGWTVFGKNNTASPQTFTVQSICTTF